MFNVDSPGFPIALLAILAGLRLVLYVHERLYRPEPAPVTTSLTPDDIGDAPAAPPGDETTAPAARRPEAAESPLHRFFAELLDSGLIAVVLVFFIIRPFILQAFFIPTGSMIPTLQVHDRLLATKYLYHFRAPKRGEVIVFRAPEIALKLQQGQAYDPAVPVDYVKRVVGLPGDRIRVRGGDGLYVNGERQDEPYLREVPTYDFPITIDGYIAGDSEEARRQIARHSRDGELVVPEGYLFVLGDNRNESLDGHKWGLLKRDRVIGKACFIFWPPDRKGFIR